MRFANLITVQLPSYKPMYPKFLQKKISVIPNEIILQSENSTRTKKYNKDFTFGFIGRFSYQKQPLRLIENFAFHALSHSDSKLVFFGKGELEEDMKMRISELGLENRIHINGPVRELNELYRDIDVICIPSLWEGFPNVLGEAMKFGIPALGNSNCLGLNDLISPTSGVLVDFEDPASDGFELIRAKIASGQIDSLSTKSQINSFQRVDFSKEWNSVVISATK